MNNDGTATSYLCFLPLLSEGLELNSNSLYLLSIYFQNHTKLYFYFRLFNSYLSIFKAYLALLFVFGVSLNKFLISGRFNISYVIQKLEFLLSAWTTFWSLEGLFSVALFWNLVFFCHLEQLPDLWKVYSHSRFVSHVWCQLWNFLVSACITVIREIALWFSIAPSA